MRTILNKIFFGALFIFMSWKGLDGLVINLFYGTTDSYDIFEIEKEGQINSRNIEIVNGISFTDDLIYYGVDAYSPVDIVYPVVSSEQIQRYNNNQPISIKVLVRLDDQDRNCVFNRKCIPKDSTLVKGLVKVGLENLGSDDFEILRSDLVEVDENVILIDTSEGPVVWYWNLLMFVVGTVFGLGIIKSFFRRASSISEYWDKVTEKDES